MTVNLSCFVCRVEPELIKDEKAIAQKPKTIFVHPETYDHPLKGSNRRHAEMLKRRIKDLLAVRELTPGAIKQITDDSYPQLAIAYKQLIAEGAIESFLTDDKIPVMKYRLVGNESVD
jgi:hypothetical protein